MSQFGVSQAFADYVYEAMREQVIRREVHLCWKAGVPLTDPFYEPYLWPVLRDGGRGWPDEFVLFPRLRGRSR